MTNPDCGPLLGWDAGWIFGQNILLETTSVVLVVAETGQIDNPGRLTSYSCSTVSCGAMQDLLGYLCF